MNMIVVTFDMTSIPKRRVSSLINCIASCKFILSWTSPTIASKCFGVVGSGNRNFNNQYCLTAKQYSQRFGFPVLADFEMRGMLGDIKKVAGIIAELYELESL